MDVRYSDGLNDTDRVYRGAGKPAAGCRRRAGEGREDITGRHGAYLFTFRSQGPAEATSAPVQV